MKQAVAPVTQSAEEPGRKSMPASKMQLAIDHSPRMVAQRQHHAQLFPETVQQRSLFPPGAVIQGVLERRQTYRALQAIDYYDKPGAVSGSVASAPKKGGSAPKKSKSTVMVKGPVQGQLAIGQLYTVISNDLYWIELRRADQDSTTTYWIEADHINEAAQWKAEPRISNSILNDIEYDNKLDDVRWKKFEKPFMPVDPSPSDITQGEVGDCWLMATMAALASSDEWIKKLKTSIVDNGDGTVTVHLFKGGESVIDTDKKKDATAAQSIVSRWLPTYIDAQAELLYSSMKSGAIAKEDNADANVNPHIWPALIEKGVAALLENSYAKLDNKGAERGMATLTGGKGMKIYTNKQLKDTVWDEILTAINDHAAGTATTWQSHADMTASAEAVAINANPSKMIQGHVYYIESADAGAKTLTLKNPHQSVHPPALTLADALKYITKIVVMPKP